MNVLAHQGGWDEFLWVAAPLAFIAYLLRLATVRARRMGPPDELAARPAPDDPAAAAGAADGRSRGTVDERSTPD